VSKFWTAILKAQPMISVVNYTFRFSDPAT
jgi:hypothetical protein